MKIEHNYKSIILMFFLIIRLIGCILIYIFFYPETLIDIIINHLVTFTYTICFFGVFFHKKWSYIITIIISISDIIFYIMFFSLGEISADRLLGGIFGNGIISFLAYKLLNEKLKIKHVIIDKPLYERLCKQCGSKLKAGDIFCPNCGTKRKFNIFFSFSILDSELFKISNIVANLEGRPEINKIFYREIDTGINSVQFIEEKLRISDIFVLFCSENALNSKSIKGEWEAVYQLKKQELIEIISVYKDEKFIPHLLIPLLKVKYDEFNFVAFINEIYSKILRK